MANVDPNDIYHNGAWYNRNGSGGLATYATDASGNVIGLIGTDGSILYLSSELFAQTSLPMIIPSSGSISAAGALSGITALPITYTKCYMFFPANAVATVSAAGFYYVVMSSTTAGTVYLNTYTSGLPVEPTSLTAVSDGKGAYTQGTGTLRDFLIIPIVANTMGKNGSIVVDLMTEHNNSASNKNLQIKLGSTVFLNISQTTTFGGKYLSYIYNLYSTAIQRFVPAALGAAGTPTVSGFSSALSAGAEDTTTSLNLTVSGQLSTVATDFFILTFASIKVNYAN